MDPPGFSPLLFAGEERRQQLIDAIQRFDTAIRRKIKVDMSSGQNKLLHLNESVFFPLPQLTHRCFLWPQNQGKMCLEQLP
jgi:hypothetical protein